MGQSGSKKLDSSQSGYLPFRFILQDYLKQRQLGRYENFLNIKGRYQGKHFPANDQYTQRLSETYELVKADSAFDIENDRVSLVTIDRVFSLDPYAQTLAETLGIPWEGILEQERPRDPYQVKRLTDTFLNEWYRRLGFLGNDFDEKVVNRHFNFQKKLDEEQMLLKSRLLTFEYEFRNLLSPLKVNEVLRIGVLFDLLKMEAPLGFRLKCSEEDYRLFVR
jgi:hypothetical protein